MAVTRARQRLVLSGVVKPHQGAQRRKPPGLAGVALPARPAASGDRHSWPGPEMGVELCGGKSRGRRTPRAPGTLAAGPPGVSPGAAPYQLSYPSQLAEAGRDGHWEAEAEDRDAARLRGEVMHRALETLAQGGELPASGGVAAALRQGGLAPAAAAGPGPGDPGGAHGLPAGPLPGPAAGPRTCPAAVSEWRLEDRPRPDTIRRGQMDRLVFDGGTWWLLDYKTSRPGGRGDWEEFIAREQEKYRPQLLAYREMAARAKGIAAGGHPAGAFISPPPADGGDVKKFFGFRFLGTPMDAKLRFAKNYDGITLS